MLIIYVVIFLSKVFILVFCPLDYWVVVSFPYRFEGKKSKFKTSKNCEIHQKKGELPRQHDILETIIWHRIHTDPVFIAN